MDNIVDMIISNESPSQISDEIKNALFAKSSEKIDELRPEIASNMFGGIADFEEE
jgi:hypothetical protein